MSRLGRLVKKSPRYFKMGQICQKIAIFMGSIPKKYLKISLKWERFLDKELNYGFFTSFLGAKFNL